MKTQTAKNPHTTLRVARIEFNFFQRRAYSSYPPGDLLDMIRGRRPIPAHEDAMIERFTYNHGHAPVLA